MATYNGVEYIREQIDSILVQTYPNIELIIADDGSSDGTITLLRSYEQNNKNVKVFLNESRLGFVKNFEYLLNKSVGNYFALSDQDDIWEPQKIEVMMKSMRDKEKGFPNVPVMVHSDLKMIDENGTLLFHSYSRQRNYHFSKIKDIPSMISRGGVMGNTILMNEKLRQLVLPFDPNVVHHDYWISVINEIFGCRVSLKETLVRYRIHRNNTSDKMHLLKKNRRIKLNKLLPYQDNNRYEVLKGIFGRYSISKEDKRPIIIFIQYLRAQGGWIKLYPTMFKEGFFKNNIHTHSKFLGRLTLASFRVNKIKSLELS